MIFFKNKKCSRYYAIIFSLVFVTLMNTSYSQVNNSLYIVTHPVIQNVAEGDTAVFTVKAGGTRPFSYQWYDSMGISIPGATDSVFRKGPALLSHSGLSFYCIVKNPFDSVTSRNAKMIVKKRSSDMITINGDLYGSDGGIVGYPTEVEKDFVINLYPSLNSDSSVYREVFLMSSGKGVKIKQSKFFIRLGEGETTNNLREVVRLYPNLYVEFGISSPGGNPEILNPRLPLTSAPYALSASTELIKGNVNPITGGIDAPIGTHYINNVTGKTYIKTHNSWVELD